MTELLPLVLLDIDGVINALPNSDGTIDDYAGYEFDVLPFRQRPVRFLYRKTVIAALNAASLDVEVRFHSMWGDAAQLDLAPEIGLRDFTVSDPNPTGQGIPYDGFDSLYWWKVRVIRDEAALNPGRPMIWLDDNISADLHHYLKRSPYRAPETLSWIRPMPHRGLDSKDLANLADWVRDPLGVIRVRRGH